MHTTSTELNGGVERLITLQEAADALGLPYFKLQRSARRGMIRVYRLYNKRPLVRLSEIVAIIERTGAGGEDNRPLSAQNGRES
jgi:hypothetical protein